MQDSQREKQNDSALSQKEENGAEETCRLFKYLRQDYIPKIVRKIPLEQITTKTEYRENQKYYKKLHSICEKYKINEKKYLIYCLKERNIREIKDCLSLESFRGFSNYLREEEQLKFVYEDFTRSANKIADVCLENGLTTSDYISTLVKNNTLAYEYYNGNISKYYLAAIQNFGELYEKLDYMNKEELSIIYEATDQLKYTLQESFLRFGDNFLKPISYTDGIIRSKLNNTKNNTNKENKSCAN